MHTLKLSLLLLFVWASLATSEARVFSTEQQYVGEFGPNINKGVPVAPPHKFAVFRHKKLTVVVLFLNQVSEGELIVRTAGQGRLSEGEVTSILAANQGGSVWKKERIETATNPNTPQMSVWTRKDGKLFAAYVTGPTPCVLIGTKQGGTFLMQHKDNITSYIHV
jgi:hypothetical protein